MEMIRRLLTEGLVEERARATDGADLVARVIKAKGARRILTKLNK